MKLKLERIFKGNGYTIGHLSINGKYFCDTLEAVDRGLSQNLPLAENKRRKLKSITAIPTGTYQVSLSVYSQKFGSRKFYSEVCDGRLPRLQNVPAFDGILIHCGNTAKDTDGCILVGENKVKGQVINSQATFRKLYSILKSAADKCENIQIEIV